MELDLHGVRHYDVDRLVENFIYLNQHQVPLRIICGNSPRMISLVKEVTDKVGCKISEPWFGVITVESLYK